MFKIVKETCTLPNSMVLRGIHLVSNEVVHGGGCADIYKGIHGDILTVLKVLRIFNRDEMKAVFRVCCLPFFPPHMLRSSPHRNCVRKPLSGDNLGTRILSPSSASAMIPSYSGTVSRWFLLGCRTEIFRATSKRIRTSIEFYL